MFDPKILDGQNYLCDLHWLGRYVARARAMPCPSAREVAEYRKARLEEIHAAVGRVGTPSRGKVGVIPVYGPLDQRQSAAMMKNGGTSCEEIGLHLDYLLKDPGTSAILLDVDSPGGTSAGIEELADRIYQARERKKVWAIANSIAASAAYWLATAASKLYVTPSGEVGSVGVFVAHVDESAALEKAGVRVSFVKAGKYKAEFTNVTPLSDEGRDHLQEMVDKVYTKFVKSLAKNRGVAPSVVRETFGQGRTLLADDAKEAGMVDGVLSYQAVLEKLGGDQAGGRSGASLAVLRARHEMAKARLA